jgi:predicted kinase
MVVIIIMGLPGTGKSTLASMLHQDLQDCVYFSTDETRKILFSHFAVSSRAKEIYEEHNIELVYNTLLLMVRKFRMKIDHIIIDATYHKALRRDKLIGSLEKWNIGYHFFVMMVGDELIKERMQQRGMNSSSDARYAEYLRLKAEWDPFDDFSNVTVIDTSSPVETSYADLIDELIRLYPGIL